MPIDAKKNTQAHAQSTTPAARAATRHRVFPHRHLKPFSRNSRQSGEITLILVILLVGAAVVFGGYKLLGVAADYMAEQVSDGLETKMFGSLGARQQGWQPTPASEKHKKAHVIFDRLRKAKGIRDLDYKLYFDAEKTPNAFALPGGCMAVTDGLLDLVESEIGLATVLGHEFGHQQHRHSLKMMGRSLLVAGGLMLIMGGDSSFILSMALGLAENSYSRDNEYEADAYGIKMVHRVFGTTKGSDEFFLKLESSKETKDNKLLNMLSTHPYTPDRIERLRKLARQIEAKGKPKGKTGEKTTKPESP